MPNPANVPDHVADKDDKKHLVNIASIVYRSILWEMPPRGTIQLMSVEETLQRAAEDMRRIAAENKAKAEAGMTGPAGGNEEIQPRTVVCDWCACKPREMGFAIVVFTLPQDREALVHHMMHVHNVNWTHPWLGVSECDTSVDGYLFVAPFQVETDEQGTGLTATNSEDNSNGGNHGEPLFENENMDAQDEDWN